MHAWRPDSISVVAPVYNESENADPLVGGIVSAVREMGVPFEVILVDDGSSDDTVERLRALVPETPELVVIALRRNFGQTSALQAGLDRARGSAIVTMDGDLQNDPTDIPRLVAELERGADVVSGWRKDRQDTLVLRKFPSWVANRLIRVVTRVPIHDQGCSLKAYRGPVVRSLDLYADMHRFIAILTMPLGARIHEVEVKHHARVAGESKYGISRVFKVMADLFSIQMLTRFRESPLRWFGLLSLPFLLAFLASGTATVLSWPGPIVMPAITILTGIAAGSCILYGFLGESIIASAGRTQPRPVLYRGRSVSP